MSKCQPLDCDNDLSTTTASSWEYSFFVPHSMASVVQLMGGHETFVNRTSVRASYDRTIMIEMFYRTHYFNKGYFFAGNEPSFAMPWAFHYANRPDLSVLRVRNVTFTFFGTGTGGVSSFESNGMQTNLSAFRRSLETMIAEQWLHFWLSIY